jgi:hypothetical protein
MGFYKGKGPEMGFYKGKGPTIGLLLPAGLISLDGVG